MKALSYFRGVAILDDVFHLAAPVFSNLVQQEAVWRTAKAHCKHARARVLLHFGNDFQVVADLAVSQKASDAYMILSVRWCQGRANGFHHFRAAIALGLG